jgi:predicted component of type VI protein secretion system
MDVRLVVEKGSQRKHAFKMRGGEMILGRKTGCGIRIPSAAVSRQHCRLIAADGFLTAEDLDSVNGTYLNGEPITEKVSVRPGDRLRVGPVTFVVEYELTPTALDKLLAWETIKNGEEPVDEFELVEDNPEPAPAEEEIPALELNLEDSDAGVPLEPAAPAAANEAEEEAVTSPDMFPFDNDQPLDLPAADQLREFLAQLEKPTEND